MSHHAHARHPLARGPVAALEICTGCSCVHLILGTVTVRLEPEAAASLWKTLGQGLERLEEIDEERGRRRVAAMS
jgi:hypothetical protein